MLGGRKDSDRFIPAIPIRRLLMHTDQAHKCLVRSLNFTLVSLRGSRFRWVVPARGTQFRSTDHEFMGCRVRRIGCLRLEISYY